jgi:hypothetical protein
VDDKEVVKFLKLIKHNKYSVVDQLKKTSVMISLLSLILSLEPYYKVLQKILNESHISQDITFESMKVTNYLCFIEDELGLEGIGSSFNVVLKCILERLSVEVYNSYAI